MATTFFSSERIGIYTFMSNNIPIFGTLDGDVTRADDVVTLSNMKLTLWLGTAVANLNKNLDFTVTISGSGAGHPSYNNLTLKTTSTTTYLGVFDLDDCYFPVGVTQTSRSMKWSSSDGFHGVFGVAFPGRPQQPTVTISKTGFDYVTVIYGTTDWGASHGGIVKLYGGTESTPTTEIASSTTLGDNTFTFTGLEPETTYYFRAMADNHEMQSDYSTTVSTTTSKEPKLYGSVSGNTKLVKKLYGSVNGEAAEIKKLYGSLNGQTKRIF